MSSSHGVNLYRRSVSQRAKSITIFSSSELGRIAEAKVDLQISMTGNLSLCSSGLSSSLIRHYQTIAAGKGLPIWLEATTPYSQKLYAGLGFKTIDEIVLGKGKAAADGTTMKGGEGVKIWGMVWRPKV